jgi:DNA-binding SARP family transcriptional activator/predicted ATPase
MPPSLTLLTLGGLELRKDDQPLTALASRKAEALLVYLAAEDKPHPREVLADLLWDDRSTAQSLGNLRVLLNSLRKHLGEELEISRQTVRLRRIPHWRMDSLDFERLLDAEYERESGLTLLTETGAQTLEEALDLYRGDFLHGIYLRESSRFEEWASLTRERLRLAAMTALENLIDFYKRCGAYPRGIRAAQRLLAFDPLREETHRELMSLLARNGQKQAALQQYNLCRDFLEKELGVTPAPETESLYQKLIQPGNLYRNALPVYSTPFIGRDTDLKRVADCLRRPDCRLLTLYGAGGMGKTRLAAQSAAQLAGDFLDGVLFVSLPDAPENGEPLEPFAETLLDALNLAPAVRQTPQAQLCAALKQQEILLVLDNFDNQPANTDLLCALIREAPGIKFLLTSRLRTGLQIERALEIGGMDIPATQTAESESFDAVQLFYQAAQRANPDFRPGVADLTHIVRICKLVMGAPLGIELAAAWVRLLDPAQIAESIQRDLSVLSSASSDIPARHRSFLAVFERSWKLLNEAEQTAFCRLAVFEGGFTFEAAREAAGVGLAELSGLVEKSFVRREGSGRYAIHPLLRQYALAGLESGLPRGENPQLAFSQYYLNFAGQREANLRGPSQQTALAEMSAEHENLRAAWQWAAAHARADLLAPALEAMLAYYEMRGHYREFSLLLEPLDGWAQDEFAGWVCAARGLIADRLAQFDASAGLSATSLQIFERLGNLRGQSRALSNLGMNAIYRGKLDEAGQFLTRALALAEQAADEAAHGRALSLLGVVHKQKGDYESARRAQDEALMIFRALDDPQRVASTANNLGSVLRLLGKMQAARACYEESLAVRRALNDPRGVALALVNLANLLGQMGDFDPARACYEESLAISESLGDPWGRALCLHNLGDMARQQGDYARAARYYADSLAVRRRVNDQTGTAFSLAGLAHTYAAQGDTSQALHYFDKAARAAQQARQLPLALEALAGATLLLVQTDTPKAARLAAFLLTQTALASGLREQLSGLAGDAGAPDGLESALVEAFGAG